MSTTARPGSVFHDVTLCLNSVLDDEIKRLGLQHAPWACDGSRHAAPLKHRDAKALCDALTERRIEAYAMADFDDASIAWVVVFAAAAQQ